MKESKSVAAALMLPIAKLTGSMSCGRAEPLLKITTDICEPVEATRYYICVIKSCYLHSKTEF